jgi:Vacuolar sorting-associated protein 13, N-terminal
LNAEVRVRTSDRTTPGPISCSADVLPFNFSLNLRPEQIFQYYRLKASILAQQRLDTMLRFRPSEQPFENPRAWWAYAISCVLSRPNSRPWKDVLPIVRSRNRYIDLVTKKNAKPSRSNGYHAGLSTKESEELLELEDLLPIEALLAFHTIALRSVYARQMKKDVFSEPKQPKIESDRKPRKSRSGRFRLPRLSTISNKKKAQLESSQFVSSSEFLPDDNPLPPTTPRSNGPSLLEAMNLRLGKKVWFVDWKLHDAFINLTLRRETDSAPTVRFVLRADGNARSFGIGKRDFLFDITQFDVLHCDDKVLFVRACDDDTLTEEVPSSSKFTVLSSEKVIRRAGPDMKMPSSFLDLPPLGSLCRIVAGKEIGSIMLSISAHPATLVWTTSLLQGVSDFISCHSADPDYDLTAHIMNAATPLARKARLALLSPASMSLHLNISAPKVWIPLISSDKEGTLFIDAGTIKVASIKREGETDADWDFHARDIGVTFVRGSNPSKMGREGHACLRTYGVPYAPIGRAETSVIKPMSIDATSRRGEIACGELVNLPKSRSKSFVEAVRKNSITVSPIFLNLVDAEMLARSFGKWYALGLGRVKRRVMSADKPKDAVDRSNKNEHGELILQHDGIQRVLSITIEKLEMAVEGHSKKLSTSCDDRSITSLDSLLEHAPSTRTYLVEIFRISMRRSTLQNTESTSLSIVNASIVRLKEASSVLAFKSRRDVIESENCVLSTSSRAHDAAGRPTPRNEAPIPRPDILRASLFHNRLIHLDEVEVDIDSVVLRVTPTTLKDCAKAFRRIAELAQLVTKEMERKVHEEGRKARWRDRYGKWNTY